MIRILQVVGTMDLGGAETFLMNIYRNIDRTKIQFDFLCHNRTESKYAEEIERMGGRMYCVQGIRHAGLSGYRKQLYRFFKEHPEYRVVHSHQDLLNGMILKNAKRAGVPHRYAHSHFAFELKTIRSKAIMLWAQMLLKNSITKAFACSILAGKSQFPKKWWEDFTFIPNAVDVEAFRFSEEGRRSVRDELGLENEIVLGHVGRFAEQKNHRFILPVFQKLLETIPDAHLLLIGGGALRPEMEELAKTLGIADRVHFLGSRRDMPACYSAMDLYFFPSNGEGLSVACVEAQSSGLPILTSTAVSSEVAFTELVSQMDLSKPKEQWVEKICSMLEQFPKEGRKGYADVVREKGFDILSLAERMQKIYWTDYHA